MRNILAIFRKELRLYFTTPVAYVVFAVFSIVSSFFFLRILTSFQRSIMIQTQRNPQMLQYLNFTDQVLTPLFYNVAVVLVFVTPFLSMRLIAEERRSGTFELLMSNPVTPLQITLGKYFAVQVVLLVMMALVGIYPLLVDGYAQVGSVAWETVASGLLGLFLMGSGFLAVGLFISALTRSQVVAAAITFCVLLLFWVVGWAASDNTGVTRDVLSAMSAVEHIRGFAAGKVALHDAVYYLSMMFLGIFLTHRTLEAQRWR
ncbi:MAG: ABC transporter permease subunit [Deltaproteobacteria bacterium]|nr:ABC transporter permease subunit [Deltaproteobacteria bacterium]